MGLIREEETGFCWQPGSGPRSVWVQARRVTERVAASAVWTQEGGNMFDVLSTEMYQLSLGDF